MSTRERWIVYPLLFLTLGIVMRDKAREMLTPTVHVGANEFAAERIHCSQLQVDQVVAAGTLLVRGIQCGELAIPGQSGRAIVYVGPDPKTRGGFVQTSLPNGAPLVLLQPTESGGVVRAAEVIQGKAAFPEKPKAAATPKPTQPTKETAKQPEKTPAKTSK
jgi:hypothetical protein